jgi:phage protein D
VRLIKAWGPILDVQAKATARAGVRLAAAARTCRVRVGDSAAGGMTCGPQRSATEGEAAQQAGWRSWAGAAVWAGRWATARAGLQRGRRRVGGLAATACWAAVTAAAVRAAGLGKADGLS